MYMSLLDWRYNFVSKCNLIKVQHSVRRQPNNVLSPLRPPAQIGACLKDVENTIEMAQDVLHCGHHLRWPVMGVQANWRPKQHQLQVCFGLHKQPTLKGMPRSYMESDFSELYMVGMIISRLFQWHHSQAQIRSESTEIIKTMWHPESARALRLCFLGCCPL